MLVAAVVLLAGIAAPRPVRGGAVPLAPAAVAPGPVSLLSYNVEGLPWPLTQGRTRAAAAIAAELRGLRARGAAPHVVAVQEAFGAAQKAIGPAAGYRYAAFGPDAALRSPAPADAAARAFLAAASAWHGETEGAQEDSGLAIFSDYPIVAVEQLAFPRFACAGYDCLANKGVLAVALRVPGVAAPLVVLDTHLNARTASGVADARSLAAYRRQVDLLRAAVARWEAAGLPVVVAGDFNVGNDPARGAYLAAALVGADRLTVSGSEISCGPVCRSLALVPSIARAKTIVFARAPATAIGTVQGFGALPDGERLSDHLGVMRAFDLNG